MYRLRIDNVRKNKDIRAYMNSKNVRLQDLADYYGVANPNISNALSMFEIAEDEKATLYHVIDDLAKFKEK